jgi:hypothetical protein
MQLVRFFLYQVKSSSTFARDLSPTTKYPEKELNAIIAKYHDDTAAIRRYMIEYGILERDAESVYWVSKTQ